MIAIAMLGLTLALQSNQVPEISASHIWLLMLSGVVGIGLGDTAYFETLRLLGARRALLLETLAPPITGVLALMFLDEVLPAIAWLGIVLTILGVAWVISERLPKQPAGSINLERGISFGLLAALAQAVGAVLSRAALAETNVSPLWAALLRLLAGVLVLLLWGLIRRQTGQWLKGLNSKRILGALILAAFGGTYLGIWLQQVGLKYAAAGIAQTLIATSPLFILPIAAWMGEAISIRAVLGVLIAVGGIALLFGLR
jgi:drug/metabolite transporter (DMT)-like permease